VSGRIAVVGGGFAGVAAACRLAGDGHRPILFERTGRLGGRAASFRDPASGGDVDYGHHVSMRCCTATDGLLRRIGKGDAIRYQSALSVPILCGKTRSDLRSTLLLPGAVHLLPALLRYRCLARRDRLAVLRAGGALLIGARADRSFGDWLRAHGQSPRAIERLWEPICVATLNARVDEVGLRAARKVLRDGFLSRDGAGLGLFTTPMSRVFEAEREYVESHGGEVRTSNPVRRIRVEAGRAVGVETDGGETVDVDGVVASVPPWELRRLIPGDLLAPTLAAAARLSWSPIVNVHLWLDRSILDEEFVIAVDSPVQAAFDVTRIHEGAGEETTHLAISQSAARAWIDRSCGEVADEIVGSLADLIPAVCGARVVRHIVIVRRRATFIPAPGTDGLRPAAKTRIDRLFLAGDWTATGWPSTVEGAVRSGIAAAARAEADLEADEPEPTS